MKLSLTLDRKNLARFRTLLKASPKMAAQALTFTAQKAKPAWIAGHSVFHKRSTWIDRGVRVKMATASNLEAQVGSVDKYMGRHVDGVEEEKRSAGGNLLVPISDLASLPPHRRMRAILRRAEGTKSPPFRWKSAGGHTFLARKPKRKGSKLKLLALLTKTVEIPERLDAAGIVEQTVREEFPTVYRRLLAMWQREGN